MPQKHHRFDVEEKPVPTETSNFERLMFQMQTYIIVLLLLSSGALSAGLEKVWKLTEFIADIYY
jgi:hypothetical protein